MARVLVGRGLGGLTRPAGGIASAGAVVTSSRRRAPRRYQERVRARPQGCRTGANGSVTFDGKGDPSFEAIGSAWTGMESAVLSTSYRPDRSNDGWLARLRRTWAGMAETLARLERYGRLTLRFVVERQLTY